MSSIVLRNIGVLYTGRLGSEPIRDCDMLISDGKVKLIGYVDKSDAETTVDCLGATVIPGLIDSHVHVVLGDFTPRQNTYGFIESYMHGGVTALISAGEFHAPGFPHDRIGVKAMALAAQRCFSGFRPGGVRVYAGCLVVEPDLIRDDYEELSAAGVWLAKLGFGRFTNTLEMKQHVLWAKENGFKVTAHTGGASIPGSFPILADELLELQPDVAGHVNGGTTSLSEDGMKLLVTESSITLQLVQAGNLSAALFIIRLAREYGQLHRVILGSDTPTGTGVLPLGILKSLAEICSLGGLPPEDGIALATGNVSTAYGLQEGVLEVGKPADLLVVDAPVACVAKNASEALSRGDIPGVSCVIIGGEIKATKSRNTPPALRQVKIY